MTSTQAFEHSPQRFNEKNNDYCARIAKDYMINVATVERNYRRQKAKVWKETSRTSDGDGNIISKVEKYVPDLLANYDLPVHRVSTNIATGQQWVIQQKNNDTSEESIKDIIQEAIALCDRTPLVLNPAKSFEPKMMSVILTDVHAGMCPKDGFLDYEWNAKLLIDAFDKTLKDIISLVGIAGGRIEELILYDLGDSLDGYEGLTTRGGHKLPQNMTTVQQFSLVLNCYISLIENILALDLADALTIHRVSNDNHSGSMSQMLGYSLESFIKRLYPEAKITFVQQDDFMAYKVYGDVAIVTTHGKDKEFMKQPMPYIMSPKWETYLGSIFKRWNLLDKKIILFKGDQHRLGYSSHSFFEYYNFMAFSPPSGWAQHNFGASQDVGYSVHITGKSRKDNNIFNRRFDI